MYFEIGANQAPDIIKIARNSGYSNIKVKRDLNNFDRYVMIK